MNEMSINTQFPPHLNPKITIRTLVDGAVMEEQLPGQSFFHQPIFCLGQQQEVGSLGPPHVIALGLCDVQ
jgi:hypothetical protein